MARVLAFLLTIFPFGVLSAEMPAQLERLLVKELRMNVIEVSSGYLDSTHDKYHLALVTDKDETQFLYFIREAPSGGIEVKDKIDVGGAGSRASWTAKIRMKSAFISVDSSGGCCSHGGSAYQFKLDRSKRLVMIGFEEVNLSSQPEPGVSDRRIFSEDNFSVNLITGTVIKTRSESEKIEEWTEKAHFYPTWRQYKLLAPIKRKVHRFRVPIEKKWTFRDLEIVNKEGDGFDDWALKVYRAE